jgi:hypothetical protein
MDYVAAIFPSVGVLFLFVLAIRAMFQADRRERLAQAQLERQARPATPDSVQSGAVAPGSGKAPDA